MSAQPINEKGNHLQSKCLRVIYRAGKNLIVLHDFTKRVKFKFKFFNYSFPEK
jgi:hypothetical protein